MITFSVTSASKHNDTFRVHTQIISTHVHRCKNMHTYRLKSSCHSVLYICTWSWPVYYGSQNNIHISLHIELNISSHQSVFLSLNNFGITYYNYVWVNLKWLYFLVMQPLIKSEIIYIHAAIKTFGRKFLLNLVGSLLKIAVNRMICSENSLVF